MSDDETARRSYAAHWWIAAIVAVVAVLGAIILLSGARPSPDKLQAAREFALVSEILTVQSRRFLVKQDQAGVVAELNLGGFEVITGGAVGRGSRGTSQIARIADPAQRLHRDALAIFPIYGALTLALWVALLTAGVLVLWSTSFGGNTSVSSQATNAPTTSDTSSVAQKTIHSAVRSHGVMRWRLRTSRCGRARRSSPPCRWVCSR